MSALKTQYDLRDYDDARVAMRHQSNSADRKTIWEACRRAGLHVDMLYKLAREFAVPLENN